MIKNLKLSIFVILIVFLVLDFLYSKYKNSKLTAVIEFDERFEYNFKKNISSKSKFGSFLVDVCTNNNGFRIKCGKKKNLKKYKLALIGDSFIEGVGLDYNNTIAGLIESKSNINVANLGVRSYSPANYLNKLIYLIENGYKFEQVIIFLDISDIQDEVFRSGKVRKSFKTETINQNNNLYSKLTSNLQMTYFLYFKLRSLIRNKLSYSNNEIFNNFDAYKKDYSRGSWTYDIKNEFREKGLNFSSNNMIDLAEYLNKRKIDFSLAIYPWPQQLIYDDINSLQVIYWRKFCKKYNCKNFYNFFEDFFQLVDEKSLNYVLLNYYFYTDIHFNRNGNNIIAEKLIRDIN